MRIKQEPEDEDKKEMVFGDITIKGEEDDKKNIKDEDDSKDDIKAEENDKNDIKDEEDDKKDIKAEEDDKKDIKAEEDDKKDIKAEEDDKKDINLEENKNENNDEKNARQRAISRIVQLDRLHMNRKSMQPFFGDGRDNPAFIPDRYDPYLLSGELFHGNVPPRDFRPARVGENFLGKIARIQIFEGYEGLFVKQLDHVHETGWETPFVLSKGICALDYWGLAELEIAQVRCTRCSCITGIPDPGKPHQGICDGIACPTLSFMPLCAEMKETLAPIMPQRAGVKWNGPF